MNTPKVINETGEIAMTSKRFLATVIILSVVTLTGCKETNQESTKTQTYEDILSELESCRQKLG